MVLMNDSLDFGLRGKVAIVAGGGSVGSEIGNGRAASILLADAGAKVVVTDKDELLAKKNPLLTLPAVHRLNVSVTGN